MVSTVTPSGEVLRAKGRARDFGKEAPVLPSTVYAETFADCAFVTYRNLPDGFRAADKGALPAANGEPDTGASAPLEELIA